MDYLDSISLSGWGKLLLAFVPTNLVLLVFDLVFYLLIPLGVLLLLIGLCKKNCNSGNAGVWRSCGKTWLRIGLFFLIANIVLYFLYNSILTTSISGIRSFHILYKEEILGARKDKTAPDNISAIASALRNKKREAAPASVKAPAASKAEGPATRGKELLDETANGLENKKMLSESEANALINGAPTSKSNAPAAGVSYRSKEYKVVKFFFNGYPWLHHLLYVLIWLIFSLWFFWPGFKMQKQKTVLSR